MPFEVHVYSAHRTPEAAAKFSKEAREKGFGAIIAFWAKAAHLAGALAANTTLPVIGVPVRSSTLDGIDALLSTVQMPSGIPGSYSCHRRSSQCRFAFRTDAFHRGRRSGQKAGRKESKGCGQGAGKRRRHFCQVLMDNITINMP